MKFYLINNNEVLDTAYTMKQAKERAAMYSDIWGWVSVCSPRKLQFCYDCGKKIDMSGKLGKDNADAIKRYKAQ